MVEVKEAGEGIEVEEEATIADSEREPPQQVSESPEPGEAET
jgi:hypothetical protein